MQASALGHSLETLHDGLTTFHNGMPVPCPLVATAISVRVVSGLAFVCTTRRFKNVEATPIEAVMTFPVGFHAVVTGLAATVDGRRMMGIAQERIQAREIYEVALDEGRLAVLHEEVLRGVHVLSVGSLPVGAEVTVELEQTVALTDAGGVPFLRLPVTAGQIYGTSPLLPSDDLVTANVRHVANLSVTVDVGRAVLNGHTLAPDETLEVLLDRALELRVEGGKFGQLRGRAADGRTVNLTLDSPGSGDAALDLHVLVDRSGSTKSPVHDGSASVWQVMREGLISVLADLHVSDRVSLWQFDDTCQLLGSTRGATSAKLAKKLGRPRGGTELGDAIRTALAAGARDILVLTDGQTWAHLVEDLKREVSRISAILVGPRSLDANIGHLCALTGGQVLYAPGRDVGSAMRTALASLRQAGAAAAGDVDEAGPKWVSALRGGIKVRADWSDLCDDVGNDADKVGGFAAALALPFLPTAAATAFACAHNLCTHMTSLVLVDDDGETTEGFSRMRKVPLMGAMADRASPIIQGRQMALMQAVTFASPMLRSNSLPLRPTSRRPPAGTGRDLFDLHMDAHQLRLPRAAYMDKKGIFWRAIDLITGRGEPGRPTPFDGFAWDELGDVLLAGDFSGLSEEQRAYLDALAMRVQACQETKNDRVTGDPCTIALGLIARRAAGRAAERFARRALRNAPSWIMTVT